MSDLPRFCFRDCRYLTPTEAEQDVMPRPRPFHFCTRYEKHVLHGGFHPELLRLQECDLEEA